MYNTGELQGFTPSMLQPDTYINWFGLCSFSLVMALALFVVYLALSAAWEKLS